MSDKSKLTSNQSHSARLEAVGLMASGIAHEINTPIQFIGDNLQFISDSVGEIDQLLKHYANLHAAAIAAGVLDDHVAAISKAADDADIDYLRDELPGAIEQSLAGVQQVARITLAMKAFAHHGAAEKEMADINQAIDMTSAVCRNEWKYNADLKLNLDPNLPKIACHIGELSQVWLNLIVNAAHAIKAHPDIGHGLITVTTASRGDGVEIEITDNGSGIPDTIRDRIFERFFSTKEAGEGSGQGLAICKDIIVEQHGGRIDVSSKIGQGTRFTVYLPTHAQQVPEQLAEEVIA